MDFSFLDILVSFLVAIVFSIILVVGHMIDEMKKMIFRRMFW
jgi:hypothetical protein